MSISKKEQFEIFKKGLEVASKLSIEDSNLDTQAIGIQNHVPYEELKNSNNFHDGNIGNEKGRYKMGGLFYCLEGHYIDDGYQSSTYNILPSHKKFVEYQSYKKHNQLSQEDRDIFSQFIDFHWEYKMVNQTGIDDANSGYGTDCSRTYYFPTADIYVKFLGYYSSYSGFEYSSFKLVEPQEKTITVYE